MKTENKLHHTQGEIKSTLWHTEECANGGAVIVMKNKQGKETQRVQIIPIESAELICKAVNMHDDLVDILERAREYVAGAYECAFPDDSMNQFVLNTIDELITKSRK